MLEIRREVLHRVAPEMRILTGAHWAETGEEGQQFCPDWDFYLQLEDQGILTTMVARDEGLLVGYAWAVLSYDAHESRKFASTDAYYLHPKYRRGRNSLRLLEALEKEMHSQGATYTMIGVHPRNDYSKLLHFMGYHPVEQYHRKEL